jgi:DNA-binding transcriptional MerR regulator
MKHYTISQLAREFGLSRSALLYYDSTGLLCPRERSEAGYRCYSERERERLKDICFYRETGMSLKEIQRLLAKSKNNGLQDILKERLKKINEEIVKLRIQQRLVASMLRDSSAQKSMVIDKELWVEMFRSIGLKDEDMKRWHEEFEHNAPDAHHEILAFMGFNPKEIDEIRKWSGA